MELINALAKHGFQVFTVKEVGEKTEITFHDPHVAQMFAGNLISWAIPRKFENRKINGRVTVDTSYVPVILELL